MKVTKKPSKEGRLAEKALQMAVEGAIEEHRRMGIPIAVMKDGKAVYVNVVRISKSKKHKNGLGAIPTPGLNLLRVGIDEKSAPARRSFSVGGVVRESKKHYKTK
jgi:hypothetical protein